MLYVKIFDIISCDRCQKEIAGVPKVVFLDGKEIPVIGLGTWNVSISEYIFSTSFSYPYHP